MKNIKEYISAEDIKYSLANTPQIVFEVTDACNLSCEYCAYGNLYSDYDKRDNKLLSVNKAIQLVQYMNQLWNSSYNRSYNNDVYIGFYGGEPFLNMSFIKKVIDYIGKMDCSTKKFIYSMTTNALLLHKHMDYLAENEFSLLISLDGDELGTSYRVNKKGKPVYDTIVHNIDLLREKHPDYFQKHVNFNAVLHNRNSVESIYSYFKEKYQKMPRIGEISSSGIREDKIKNFEKAYRNSEESLNQSEHYSKIVQDMGLKLGTYQSVGTYLLGYSDYVYSDYNELLYGKESVAKHLPTGTCVPFSKKVFMTVNDKLLPCERIGHQFALGKVTQNSVELDFDYIADKYNMYYSKIDTQCKSCHNQKTCIQCIYNLPDIDDKTVICHGYMDKKAFEVYRNTQLAFLANNPEAYTLLMEDTFHS